MSPFTALALAALLLGGRPETPLVVVPDPRAALTPQTAEQSAARHAAVARARAGTAVLLHRGASQYAPENTISAYLAAFEVGADGVELDFRRTKDGVIVFFHDERLERLLDGVGSVEDSYYEELLLYTFASPPAVAAQAERVPTLRNVLEAVRDHAGLLHLDIKMPGIDRELLDALQKADMLDHVVTYNDYNSEAFRKAAVVKLPFKGSLMEGGQDTDPRRAKALLERPGKLVIADDPRAVLTVLGRPPVKVSPKSAAPPAERAPGSLEPLEAVLRGTSDAMPVRLAAVRLAIFAPGRFAELAPELQRQPSAEVRRAVAWNLGMIAKHRPGLIAEPDRAALRQLLGDREIAVRAEAAVACARAGIEAAVPRIVELLAERPADLDQWTEDEDRLRERRTIVEARARCALALGLLGVKTPPGVEALADAVRHRAIDRELMRVGVDGAMAAWALGKLHAAESVGVLKLALFRDDPALAPVSRASSPAGKPAYPPGWCDFRMRTFILPALAEIGSDDALAVLESVLNASEKDAAHLSPYLRARAADALAGCRVADRAPVLAGLLKLRAPEARQSAIFACWKQSDPRYRKLLESAAPWAVAWWDIRHRPQEQ